MHKDADTTSRSVMVSIDDQEVKGCSGLGMMAVKVNNMDDKLDTIIQQQGKIETKVDDLNHAKRDGGTAGGITGIATSGVALFCAWLWTKISGGG